MSDKYCYSHNEEDFTGCFDTREAALAAASEYDYLKAWTARQVPISETLANRSGWMIDAAMEELNDYMAISAGGDGSAFSLSSDQYRELGALIAGYIEEHANCSRWEVADIQEHEVEQPK